MTKRLFSQAGVFFALALFFALASPALAQQDQPARPAKEARQDQPARPATEARQDQPARPATEARQDQPAQPAKEARPDKTARPSELTAEYFAGQAPLADADIDFYLKLVAVAKDRAKAEEGFRKLIATTGFPVDRIGFVTAKVGNGVNLKKNPQIEAKLIKSFKGVKEVIPSKDEQALIERRFAEIVSAFDPR